MATTVPGGWLIESVDTVGDVGRFSSIQRDPNFPTINHIVMAYKDTSHGTFKYGVQFKGAWKRRGVSTETKRLA